jgi:hypothetical protein
MRFLRAVEKSAMDDTFWESLRQGFTQLRAECAIDLPLKAAGRLTAIWTAPPATNTWRFNYHDGKDGAGNAKRFGWAAESAAARMGFAGSENEAVFYWLDQIKSDAPASHIQTLNEGDEVYSVEILDICGLSADYCRKCHAIEIRGRRTQIKDGVNLTEVPPSRNSPPPTAGSMFQLAELPSEFQRVFETSEVKAELEHAKRAQRFPNNPQIANLFQFPILIQSVFFAFCEEARGAGRSGVWQLARVRQATDAAHSIIYDFYMARERVDWPEEANLKYRNAVWQTTSDEARWHTHLAEMATLGETKQAPAYRLWTQIREIGHVEVFRRGGVLSIHI